MPFAFVREIGHIASFLHVLSALNPVVVVPMLLKIRISFCIILASIFLSINNHAYSQLLPRAESNSEFRGIWVITWEIFRHQGAYLKGEELKKRIDTIMDNVKKGGLNAVIWQVRQGSTVYFPSQIEAWGKWTQYREPGFDPLAYAVKAAKLRNLEFHAWLNTFEAGDSSAVGMAKKHPEWVCRDSNGALPKRNFALSPGLPQVRAHIQSVVMELVNRYEVDGIHLDYIRWSEFPMGESDFPTNALPQFQFDTTHSSKNGIPTGFANWNEWRRAMVTTFVSELKQKLSAVPRPITLSVAAIGKYNWGGWNGYHLVHQDAALWFNQGFIDHLMPMNYSARTPEKLQADLEGNCPSCWKQYLQEGLAAGRKFSVGIGSYMLNTQDMWQNHQPLLEVVRRNEWVSGLQFFSYGDWEKRDYFSQAPEVLWP